MHHKSLAWDIVKNKGIIKITPSIFYHQDAKLLEFGWIYWSFVIKFN